MRDLAELRSRMRVLYICPFGKPHGYARAAQDYILALVKAGVDVTISPLFTYDSRDLHEYQEELEPLVIRNGHPQKSWTHIIVHAMPADAMRFTVDNLQRSPEAPWKLICITTWETNLLNESLRTFLETAFDAVIVPSLHCKRAIAHHLEPLVVPHALDEEMWYDDGPDPREWDEDPLDRYVFYTIGVGGERKNIEGLLRAYLTEFRSSDRVVLRILCQQPFDELIEAVQVASKLQSFPRIELETRRLSYNDLVEFHDCGHCYVSASRGEGWGLGAFEAVARGRPLIVSAYGGWVDFVNNTVGWKRLVAGSMTPVLPMGEEGTRLVVIGGAAVRMRTVEVSAPVGIDGSQLWFEPSLAEFRDHMRIAYTHRIGQVETEYFNADHVADNQATWRKHYSYQSVGEQLANTLVAIHSDAHGKA